MRCEGGGGGKRSSRKEGKDFAKDEYRRRWHGPLKKDYCEITRGVKKGKGDSKMRDQRKKPNVSSYGGAR